jgi:hypothetical protein
MPCVPLLSFTPELKNASSTLGRVLGNANGGSCWIVEARLRWLHKPSRGDADFHRVDEPFEIGLTVYLDIVRARDIESSGSNRNDDGLSGWNRSRTEQMREVMLAACQVLPVLS